jgi:hypothetical protein
VSNSLVYAIFSLKRASLVIYAVLLGTLTNQAAIWIGMTEKAAFAELSQPQASLRAGEKEIHLYEESRRIDIFDSVIESQGGFPSSIVIEAKMPKPSVQANDQKQGRTQFVDFATATKPNEESFTLTNAIADKDAVTNFIEKTDPNILYLTGGGILALAGLVIYFIYKLMTRNRPLSAFDKQSLVNSQLPPFLNASPIKEPVQAPPPSIGSPLQDVHSKRTSRSIRERKSPLSAPSDLPRKTPVKRPFKEIIRPELGATESTSSTKLKLHQD